MTLRQLFFARNWLLASYDDRQLRELGLPPDHARRIAARDFSGYVLVSARLPEVNLSCFSLREANFARAIMRGAHLCCADFSNATLARADIALADLQDADLRRAQMQCADFERANLRGANLRAADLTGANLALADIAGAAIELAQVTTDQIRSARNWRQATFNESQRRDLGLPEDHNDTITARFSMRRRILRNRVCCAGYCETVLPN